MILRSEGLVVVGKHGPSLLGHEAWGQGLTSLGHSAHLRARDELEVLCVWRLWVEELHSGGGAIVGSDLEWKHIDAAEVGLGVHKELLAVPHVVEILVLLWVLNTSGVATSDEVGHTSADTGAAVPEHLGWTTVVHWGWPDGEDNVLRWEGAIVNESLVLLHTGVEWHIVILAPATKWVKQKDWVLVSGLHELLTGVLKQENVTIMEWVADLEAIDGISLALLDLLVDLSWSESVLVEAIVELDAAEEVGALGRDQPVALLEDGRGLLVLGGHAAEGTGADLLLSVGEEGWLVHDGKDIVTKLGALDSNSWLALKLSLLLGSHVLGDWHGHEVLNTVLVGHGLHVHGLKKLHLVHEASEWEGPALRDGLKILDLVEVNVENWHGGSGGELISRGLNDVVVEDNWVVDLSHDTLVLHVLHDEGNRLVEGHLTSVDVEVTVLWLLVRVGDTSEVLDLTSTGLLVETLNITALANLKGGRDVALEELEVASLVEILSSVSVLGVWGDEGDEHDHTCHVEELGDLSDTADVLLAVLLREAKTLVETSADNITIEDEALAAIAGDSVDVLLESLGEGGLSGTGETSEPVGGTREGLVSDSGMSVDHWVCCFGSVLK